MIIYIYISVLSVTAVHIVAHLFNFEYFMDAQLNRNSSLLTFVLSDIGTNDSLPFLNPIRTNETVRARDLICGLMLLLLLLLLLPNSENFGRLIAKFGFRRFTSSDKLPL